MTLATLIGGGGQVRRAASAFGAIPHVGLSVGITITKETFESLRQRHLDHPFAARVDRDGANANFAVGDVVAGDLVTSIVDLDVLADESIEWVHGVIRLSPLE